MTRITKEELLEKIFNDDYEHLKGKKLRMTRVRVPGKEVCLAHIINTSQTLFIRIWDCISVYMRGRITPENPLVSIRLPMGSSCRCCGCGNESADVEIGFMDRFCGSLILTGGLSQVQTAVEEVVRFFS